MRRRLNAFITQNRTTGLGPLSVVRSRDLPPMPDDAEPIVSAINQLEQHLDGLRDAGRRLVLVRAELETSAEEVAASMEPMEAPAEPRLAASPEPASDTAVPSIPAEERRAHLRLLKTVA